MLRNVGEKLRAKFCPTWLNNTLFCFSSLNWISKLHRRSITGANGLKEEKIDFCACLSNNAVKSNATGKKGMLSCCKCSFEKTELISSTYPALKYPKCLKYVFFFWQNALRVNGLKHSQGCEFYQSIHLHVDVHVAITCTGQIYVLSTIMEGKYIYLIYLISIENFSLSCIKQ